MRYEFYVTEFLCVPPPNDQDTNNGERQQQPIHIPLKILPGQPGSGYPTILLEGELSSYWPRTIAVFLVATSSMVLLPWILFTTGDGDTVLAIAGAFVWSFITGLLLARNKLKIWEEKTLRSGLQTRAQQQQLESHGVV